MGRAKDARHKLTVQRLQRHVTQLQVHLDTWHPSLVYMIASTIRACDC